MSHDYTKGYLKVLSKVFARGAVTNILEAGPNDYRTDDFSPQTVYIRRLSLEGAGTYARDTGYDEGTADVKWDAHTFAFDRGKLFDFDAVDSVEAYEQAAVIATEFYRTKIIPEVDAYRFYKMYAIRTAADANADLTVDTIFSAIDTAIETMDDYEVPQEDRVLYVSNSTYNLIKNGGEVISNRLVSENNPILNRNIMTLDGMPVIKVPKSRFSTAPVFSATNGYAAGGYYFNFIIAHTPSIIAIMKHVAPKLITPENHQSKDAYRIAVRVYQDLFIPANAVRGVYLHRKTTGI